MKQISFKKILIVFIVIFLMSRSYRIIEFFSNFDGSDILTLQPLRDCSEQGRYIVTILFFTFCFVIIWKFLINRKK